jgi:hypothetical protein
MAVLVTATSVAMSVAMSVAAAVFPPAGTAAAGAAEPAAVGADAQSSSVSVSPATTPAFSPAPTCPTGTPAYSYAGSGDAPDPDVVDDDGTYYAFTTGTATGNHLQALVSRSPTAGYQPFSGTCYWSSALPLLPGWEQVNTQTSPGVFFYDGRWIMFYDAALGGYGGDTGHDCLSVATASTLEPTGAWFADPSSGPLLCQPTGSIDPSPYVDPSTGRAYLAWKQNDGGSTDPAYLWAQPLSTTGTAFAPGSQPTELMYNDTVAYPWEATVEDPDMVDAGGTWYLLFSAGIYTTSGYSEAVAECTGPTGPCGTPYQILTSYGSVLGPGGGSLFPDQSGNWLLDYAAWQGGSAGCTDYACGAARRLFIAPVTFPASDDRAALRCDPPPQPAGYRAVASDGGVFAFGDLPYCGSMGGRPLAAPVVDVTATPGGGGYWEVATDGGIFAFGDAGYFGSMGGRPLDDPVVALAGP